MGRINLNQNENKGFKEKTEKELLKILLDKTMDGIVVTDLKDDTVKFRIIEANNVVIKQLGYTKTEMLKMSIYDIVTEDEIENLTKSIEKLLEEEQILFETKILSKEKKIIYIQMNCFILNVNERKLCIYIWRDTTESKITEKALRESEERYRELVEFLPDAVHIKYKSKIVYSNEAGAKLLGVENPKELIGRYDGDFTHPDYIELSKDRGKKVVCKKDKAPLVEAKIIRADGESVDIEVASVPVEHNGDTAILSVIRDITERKKSDEAIKKIMNENEELLNKAVENEKLKTEFFTDISHEFKTPLNVILGAIQLLNINNSNAEIDLHNKYTNIMKQNCYRLLRLINNIIDINKVGSGYLELDFKNHNIVSVIEDVTLSVAEYAQNRGLSITFDTEVEEKIMACDEEKIERIMLNLLSNAIKYSKDSGEIYVDIYDQNENILITVKDTGIGIPENKLNDIFKKFKQVDTSLHGINQGSGIGLALVKSLVEKHGGQIWVESNYGEGTEFYIKLPVKLVPEQNNENLMRDSSSKNSIVEKIHIEFSDIYK